MASGGKGSGTPVRLIEDGSANAATRQVDKSAFTEIMSRIAASVWVVTAGHGASRVGRTATSVMSLTAEPPRLVAAISAISPLAQAIIAEGGFSLSLLAQGQEDIGDAFAGKIPPADRFLSRAWESWPSGRPRLRGAVAAIDCELAGVVDTGANTLFMGTLIATEILDADPLLWQHRAYHGLTPALPRKP